MNCFGETRHKCFKNMPGVPLILKVSSAAAELLGICWKGDVSIQFFLQGGGDIVLSSRKTKENEGRKVFAIYFQFVCYFQASQAVFPVELKIYCQSSRKIFSTFFRITILLKVISISFFPKLYWYVVKLPSRWRRCILIRSLSMALRNSCRSLIALHVISSIFSISGSLILMFPYSICWRSSSNV